LVEADLGLGLEAGGAGGRAAVDAEFEERELHNFDEPEQFLALLATFGTGLDLLKASIEDGKVRLVGPALRLPPQKHHRLQQSADEAVKGAA